jgi:hypothetical protein
MSFLLLVAEWIGKAKWRTALDPQQIGRILLYPLRLKAIGILRLRFSFALGRKGKSSLWMTSLKRCET